MSESKEMYLISIAQLNEVGVTNPVPLSQLAAKLEVQTVSANQMVRKLEDAGLVIYTPYQGVELTKDGMQVAASVLRKRRLWEVFLVDSLHFAAPEAEVAACRLEHILSDVEVERLAEYLGGPIVSPQGKPIPKTLTGIAPDSAQPLSNLNVGDKCSITRLQVDSAARSFLAAQEIRPQTRIHLLAKGSDGELLVTTEAGTTTHLSVSVASEIWVE